MNYPLIRLNIKHVFTHFAFEYEGPMEIYHCCKTVRTKHMV